MTNKKLNAEQIQFLYDFTAAHFVEWYDLQTELVDHLANGIEEKWQKNPMLSFEDILNLEFKKFGVFGFEDVVSSRRKALTKEYNKIVWQFIKSSFSISTLIFLFAIIFLLVRLFSNYQYGQQYFFGFIGLTIFFLIAIHFKIERIKKKRRKFNCKKFLLEDIIYRGGNYVFFVSGVAPQLLLRINNVENLYTQLLISVVSSVISIFLYVVIYAMPLKVDEFLLKTYPKQYVNTL